MKSPTVATTISQRFADFICQLESDELPERVACQAKRCIVDFFGVALGGSKVGLVPHLKDIFLGMGGGEEASILGEVGRYPALTAALVNAAKGHALDMDDGHRFANAHPAVAIIPAALALAERENAVGNEVIAAVVAGYETFLRVARSINPLHLQRGFHSTATVGPFGAAAACAKILHLDRVQTANALAIAGLQSAGLLEVLESGQVMKPLHPAKAAHAGVLSALLAARGLKGPDRIFEGTNGFLRAYSDLPYAVDPTAGLSDAFEIENVYFKRFAACRHVHPALDLVAELVERYALKGEEISRITVHTYSIAASLTGKIRQATNELEAKFSIPISLGLLIRYGAAGADDYRPETITDPLVRAIAEKVEIVVEPERDLVYPEQRGAFVQVQVGENVYSSQLSVPKGDPEQPFSDQQLKEKFLCNAVKVLPQGKALKLYDLISELELHDARELAAATSPDARKL